MGREVRASGTTSMAAALNVFYQKKQQVDLFVLVSDEGENTKVNGRFFAQLLAKYRAEVNPRAKCAFVSFLSPGNEGLMLQRMRGEEGVEVPPQHRFDPSRPDLSKFDGLLTTLLNDAQRYSPLEEAREQAQAAEVELR